MCRVLASSAAILLCLLPLHERRGGGWRALARPHAHRHTLFWHHLLALFANAGVCAPTPTPTRAAEPPLYNNITLYTPIAGTDRYLARRKKRTSLDQLASLLAAKGLDTVVRVEAAPAELLRLSSCSDEAQYIDDVELEDGMQLAVVVEDGSPYDELSKARCRF